MSHPHPPRCPTAAIALAAALLVGGGCSRTEPRTVDEAAFRSALQQSGAERPGARSWTHLAPAVERERQGTGSWDDRRDGPTTTFYESGVRASEGRYANGRREGLWQYWHENGRLRWQGTYARDELQGQVLTWHPSGELESVVQYVDGERRGRALTYWDDGTPRSEGNYLGDERSGPFFYWQRDGSPDVERSGVYDKDRRQRALEHEQLARSKPSVGQ